MTTPVDDVWKSLLVSATVGTERAPFSPTPGGPLRELLAAMQGREAEHVLLGVAGADSLYRRAGRLPDTIPPTALPPPADADTLPRCSAASTRHLQMMLQGQFREALPEWLNALKNAGRRLPEEYLPDLLDMGRRESTLRPLLLPVIGKRGEWLAAQNPNWRYVVGEELDETLWETGRREERIALLQRLRSKEPGRGRELVEATWEAEKPEDRAAFLQTFQTGLSMDDEPFLEAALDDRRKEVREAASGLLARLPESRLVKRMIERVAPLLTLIADPPSTDGPLIEVRLPETFDKAMLRDTLEKKPRYGMGERAWWLAQMLATIPPDFWNRKWNLNPVELISIALKGDYKHPLMSGWGWATWFHPNAEWAEALLFDAPNEWEAETFKALCDLLPQHVLEERLLRLCGEETLGRKNPARPFLLHLQGPWSRDFSLRLIRMIKATIQQTGGTHSRDWEIKEILNHLSLTLDTGVAPETESGWPSEEDGLGSWGDSLHTFIAVLNFRNDMLKELAS